MRIVFVALAALSLALAGCARPDNASEDASSGPQLIAWEQIPSDSISVPEGVSYIVADIDGASAAQIAGVPEDATSTWRRGGVGVRMPDEFESQASGSLIRVTVRASAPEAGAQLGIAYSTADVGNSGWRQFELTTQPADYTFEYDVPVMNGGNGDFVGVRSYGGGVVLVHGYRVERLGPSEATPAAPAPAAIQEAPPPQ